MEETGSKAESKSPNASGEVDSTTDYDNELKIPTWRFTILCVSLCIGLFLSLLDTTIVATALYTIGNEFQASITVNWTVLGYTLAYVGCAVIYASISNTIGRRNAYISALILFVAFSLGSGFAQSIHQLIAFRVLQGIGGSGLYALTLVILPEITKAKMQASIGSMIGMVVAVAGVLGPVLGGIITRYTTWRWIFWINGPIGLTAFFLFALAWPPPSQIPSNESRPLRQIDILGCILLIAASVLTVFAFQQTGLDVDAWNSAIFIAPLVVGLFCWGLLFAWEFHVARYRKGSIDALVPLKLLKIRVFAAGTVATLLTGFTYFLVIYNLPIRFEVVNVRSPLAAGVSILPLVGSAAVGSMVAGFLSAKKDRTFFVLVGGACFVLLGSGLLMTLKNSLHVEKKAYGFQVFVGLGFGLTVAGSSIMTSFEVERRDSAIAQGIVAQFRVLGGSIGVAASSAIRGAVEKRELGTSLLPETVASSGPEQGDIRQAYTDSFSEDMLACTIIAALCVVVSGFTFRRYPMSTKDRWKGRSMQEKHRSGSA